MSSLSPSTASRMPNCSHFTHRFIAALIVMHAPILLYHLAGDWGSVVNHSHPRFFHFHFYFFLLYFLLSQKKKKNPNSCGTALSPHSPFSLLLLALVNCHSFHL